MTNAIVGRTTLALAFVVMLTLTGLAAAAASPSLIADPIANPAGEQPQSPTGIPLKADMLVENSSVIFGTPMTFKGFAGGGNSPYNFSWDFGDGSPTGYEAVVNHSFSLTGWRTVTFTVTDSTAATAMSNQQVYTTALQYFVQTAPSRNQIFVGEWVTLYVVAGGGVAPYNYTWNFGDGSPPAYTATVDHRYLSSGYPAPSVTVRDAVGTVKFSNTNLAVYSNAPVIGSLATPPAGTDPLQVDFSSFVSFGNPPYNITWYPDDGSPVLYGGNVSHIYGAGGFNPAVNVIDSLGASTWAYPGDIYSAPAPNLRSGFLHSPPAGRAPLLVDFHAEAAGGPLPYTYYWNFGDGSAPAQGQDQTHTYYRPGGYSAQLTVVDSGGSSVTSSRYVQARGESISAYAVTDPPVVALGEPSLFQVFPSGGIPPYSINWNFGDGTYANGSSVLHRYSDYGGSRYGYYTVCDSIGECSDSSAYLIVESLPPLLSVAADPPTATPPSLVQFHSRVSGATGILSYLWNFGDGTPLAAGMDPLHGYGLPGSYLVRVLATSSNGWSSQDAFQLEIVDPLPPFSAGASMSGNQGSTPFYTSFFSNPSGGNPPYSWAWDFGDGAGSLIANTYHFYYTPGTYLVNLEVTDSTLQTASQAFTIRAYNGFSPRASFSASPPGGPAPLDVVLRGYASGGNEPYMFEWNFGDGSPRSYQQNASHRYERPGDYGLSLTVRDSDFQSATYFETVTASQYPFRVAASADPVVGEVPLMVDFAASATGGMPPYEYVWRFGDDTGVAWEQNPTHVYWRDGYTWAQVTVFDSIRQRTDAQIIIQPVLRPFFVSAESNPASGDPPLNVSFHAEDAGAIGPAQFYWDFGDGSAPATGRDAAHEYLVSNWYGPTVRAVDALGRTAQDWTSIPVWNGFFYCNSWSSPPAGVEPHLAFLGGNASGGVPPYNYTWDFGDGTPAEYSLFTPHAYDQGDYYPTLNILDSVGASNSCQTRVYVDGVLPLAGTPYLSPGSGLAPLTSSYSIDPQGGVPPYSATWDFGDGTPQVSQFSGSHLFSNPGYYSVRVTVSDSRGAQVTRTVTAAPYLEPLRISVAADRQTGYAPHTVLFEGFASGGRAPLTGLWNFGDGTVANGFSLPHTYMNGNFYARLTVRDADGRVESRQVEISVSTITTSLSVQMAADPRIGLAPCDIQFTSQASGGNAPYVFSWDFGDGARSTMQNPLHLYPYSGTFYSSVTIMDSRGEIASSNSQVECRYLPFLMSWTADPPAGTGPLWVSFDSTLSGGTAPYTVVWNFGDGSPTDPNPDPTHYFASPGSYYVTLSGYDSNGNNIDRGNWLYFPSSAPQLTATARITPTSGVVGQPMVFNGSVAGGNPPYTYLWDFWDFDTDTSLNTTHRYAYSNWFYPQLTVTDVDGNVSLIQYTVYVDQFQLYADINADPATGDAPLQVDFDGMPSGGVPPYDFLWDLGNGQTSTVEDPTTTYTAIGSYSVSLRVTDALANTATDWYDIRVFPFPVSSTASGNVSIGTVPLPVGFSASGSGGNPPFDFYWEFGDGATAWGQNPSHDYTSPGNYTARVRVTDSAGMTSFSSVWVQANPPPSADASVSPNPTRPGVSISFIGSGGGGTPPLTYFWEFGDGATATTNNASHAYAAPGIYDANLTVTDSFGMTATKSVAVDVRAPPVAALTATPRPTTVGVPVQFNGSATGGVPGYTWSWSFGDNASSTAQDVAHTYTVPGDYVAVLTVTDSFGGVDTEKVAILVNGPPTASANAAPSITDVGRPVAFSGSGAGGTAGYTYYWDFGDSSGTTVLNPSHSYSSAGLYTATLWVADSLGVSGSRGVQVQVNPAPGLVADATPTSTDIGVPVAFTSSPSDGTGGFSYYWEFGDSSTSTAQNPSHAYSTPGVYQVNLTATDSVGGTASVSFAVKVNVRPTASATATPNPVTAGVPVAMTCPASFGTPAYIFAWDFGDGGSSVAQNPSHSYTAAGMYTATCTVTDSVGAQASANRTIAVNPVPVANASSNVSVTTVGVPVEFTSRVSGGTPGNNINWAFGDGDISSLSNPVHTYGAPGVYLVNLTVTDSLGVVSLDTITVTVNPGPASGIGATQNPTTVGVPVDFTLTPSDGTPPYTFAWTFGDGGTSTSQNPSHSYVVAGNYLANVTLRDSRGVATMRSLAVVVNPLPTGTASATPTTTTVGAPVQFNLTGSGGTDPMTISWDFGDGSTSSLTNPTHSYASPGGKTATVTVTDALGVQDSDSVSVTVNPTATLSLSATPNPTSVGVPVRFECTATGGTAPFAFEWQFGDGNSSSQNNVSHAYARNGTLTAVCFFTDGVADRVSGSLTIQVAGSLSMSASVSKNETTVGATVAFNSTAAGGRAPYNVNWFFGDGVIATTKDASHAYAAPGAYNVSVVVRDALGNAVSGAWSIKVNPPVVAPPPVPSTPTANVGQTIRFGVSPSGGTAPYRYLWDFSDGGNSGQTDPSHAFQTPGTYQVSVVIVDRDGDSASSSVNMTINPAPSAAASASMLVTDVGVSVGFNASGSGGTPPYSYSWKFGDGSTSTEVAPSHTYATPGLVTVEFTLEDSTSDAASVSFQFRVNPAPSLTVAASASSIDLGDSVTIAATVSGGTGIASVTWSGLPTGCTTANATSLICKPTVKGDFTVTGTVRDLVGKEASASVELTVTAGTLPPTPGDLGAALPAMIGFILLLLGAVIALAALLMRAKNRSRDPLPEVTPDEEEADGTESRQDEGEYDEKDESVGDDYGTEKGATEKSSSEAGEDEDIEKDGLSEEENLQKDDRA